MTTPRSSKRLVSTLPPVQIAVELVVELAYPFEDFVGPSASDLMWDLRALRPVLGSSDLGRVRLSLCVCAYDIADAVRTALTAVRGASKIPVVFINTERIVNPKITPVLVSA